MNSEYRLENECWLGDFALDKRQLWLRQLVVRQTSRPLLTAPALFCQLAIGEGGVGGPVAEHTTTNLLQVRWPDHGLGLTIRLDGASLHWELSVGAVAQNVQASFPFLAALQVSDDQETLLGEYGFRDRQGRTIFRHIDFPLPIVKIGSDGHTITLLRAPEASPTIATPEQLWQTPGFALERTITFELICHHGGWPAAFDLFRQRVRARFDLSQYQRPDLAWYGDQLVQHFTFLYGREILNLDSGQFELTRFLDEGEQNFGGYDGFLIWGVYPRIGVDERTQWDFYDDFPGGREGLRQMARHARARDVRFFVPYKPWDRSADLHQRPTAPDHTLLAQLVADVEADGVFLDTLSAIGGEFRTAIDQLRPGVVFCSEGRAKGAAFEVITGAWDQSPNRNIQQGNWSASEEFMPGVDLWRFVFPEHRQFVINRHSVGDDRLRIIQRGFFGGTGWVVWQDIFGLVLTYSPDEAALLKKCRIILKEQRQALWSGQPTPLLKTLAPGVYANEFPGATKRLWTFYNEHDQPVSGPFLRIQPRADCHYVDVWNDRESQLDGDGCLHLHLAPRTVGAVVELPRLLTQEADGQIAVRSPVANATFHVHQSRLDWQGSVESSQGRSLRSLLANRSGTALVRLLADGELLDQIVLSSDKEQTP
jgi:hypothetical protein